MENFKLFAYSLQSWQTLVDVIESHKSETGVCELSQKEMAQLLGKSPSWVSKTIKVINREVECIQKVKSGYVVDQDSYHLSVFLYLNILLYLCDDPSHFFTNENVVAKELGIKRETLQAVKTYLRDEVHQEIIREEKESGTT